ncbi:uncharacterized protein MYCFIDRAFT_174599 [Pseudocercospora fijiensis CIRAD86]|uniref:Uncharacterized protein n=1 Tax=Pseudocercospora fijiensis (strain CIRAD86) TaxID=383855 RepID=M2ZVV1_PSEFD|nr:uncharacterized protein MYCFIDRAFT_174599 [Pseudocercospora fijiensis CIRAD86]EME83124.1 hypothetical protein MYCFIDRAFT_174599 [Pseudocercospora fijiensis CIRAD86]
MGQRVVSTLGYYLPRLFLTRSRPHNWRAIERELDEISPLAMPLGSAPDSNKAMQSHVKLRERGLRPWYIILRSKDFSDISLILASLAQLGPPAQTVHSGCAINVAPRLIKTYAQLEVVLKGVPYCPQLCMRLKQRFVTMQAISLLVASEPKLRSETLPRELQTTSLPMDIAMEATSRCSNAPPGFEQKSRPLVTTGLNNGMHRPLFVCNNAKGFSRFLTMKQFSRPMWVWNTYSIISSSATTAELLSAANCSSITDLYPYMDASHYGTYFDLIRSFISRSYALNIHVWALEGGRVYFSDTDGPAHFYKGIQNLIGYNTQVQASEKFAGFSADLEPYARNPSGSLHGSFHNGVKDSDLETAAGTGVWQESQAADRSALMRDWLDIHQAAKAMLNAADLPLAAAFPHWTSNYCGEPLQVRWPDENATLRNVMELMMTCVDDYVVMSYHTEPTHAANRVVKVAECASRLRLSGGKCRPRVFASVETTTGIGERVSYGDAAIGSSRAAVIKDIDIIVAGLQEHDSFAGVAIHAWSGWRELSE